MLLWLLGVAVLVVIYGMVWQANLLLAFGILVGLILAWFASFLLDPYVTGMQEIPLWLPPLPMATVAIVLFVYGVIVWIRGNDSLSKKKSKPSNDGHH